MTLKIEFFSGSYTNFHLSKDNICENIGIEGVNKVHNGINDCILEWKLFERMDEHFLYLDYNDNIYKIMDDYYIPATNIKSYKNIKNYKQYKNPKMKLTKVKEYNVPLKHYVNDFKPTTLGNIMEAIIAYKLKANSLQEESLQIQKNNKRKLELLTKLHPHFDDYEQIIVNEDGTIPLEGLGFFKRRTFNKTVKEIEYNMNELTTYITSHLFHNEVINSQEVVLNEEDHILARCDFSNSHTVLEVKTTSNKLNKYNSQIYYQSKGRDCYFLKIDMNEANTGNIIYTIYKAEF